jgi:CheY-like chemotaxis protein
MKVLLVDDDQDDRQSFAEAVSYLNLPVQVQYASDSKEMFEFLEQNEDVHLILLDINMPFRDGKQCLRDLKSNERFKHIPVIIYTVSSNTKDINETFEQGAHYYVIKPYAKANFHQSLKYLFNLDWTVQQPKALRENYVINLAFI